VRSSASVQVVPAFAHTAPPSLVLALFIWNVDDDSDKTLPTDAIAPPLSWHLFEVKLELESVNRPDERKMAPACEVFAVLLVNTSLVEVMLLLSRLTAPPVVAAMFDVNSVAAAEAELSNKLPITP